MAEVAKTRLVSRLCIFNLPFKLHLSYLCLHPLKIIFTFVMEKASFLQITDGYLASFSPPWPRPSVCCIENLRIHYQGIVVRYRSRDYKARERESGIKTVKIIKSRMKRCAKFSQHGGYDVTWKPEVDIRLRLTKWIRIIWCSNNSHFQEAASGMRLKTFWHRNDLMWKID